jgi:nicotinic acid mononucleotide adenylyltransferase
VYFLCGADVFLSFFRPNIWDVDLLEKIFMEFHIVMTMRAGSVDPMAVVNDLPPLPRKHGEGAAAILDLRQHLHNVVVCEIPSNQTSSSEIRCKLSRRGEPDEGTLHPSVADIIRGSGLYVQSAQDEPITL